MESKKVRYRKLRKYKYQTLTEYVQTIDIKGEAENKFISLSAEGLLRIKAYYAWDGPSGPTIDTPNFMRASLVHDALYQLLRAGQIEFTSGRKDADILFKEMCIEDGMFPLWAKFAYLGLRWFGAFAAKPQKDIEEEEFSAPT